MLSKHAQFIYAAGTFHSRTNLLMSRPILDEAQLHPAIRRLVADDHIDLIREVRAVVATHEVVVIGMRQNPFPRKARRLLDTHAIPYKYLEYGSYFSGYRRRLPLKLWTGWSTFPMIFIKGVLIGGASELEMLLNKKELAKMMESPREGGGV